MKRFFFSVVERLAMAFLLIAFFMGILAMEWCSVKARCAVAEAAGAQCVVRAGK